MRERARLLYERLTADTEHASPVAAAARAVYRWSVVFFRKLQHDTAFIRAGAMAYTTLIALVPSLLLVFAVLDTVGLLAAERAAIESLVFSTFLADIPEVRELILPGLLRVDLGALGIVGVLGLVLIAAQLYLMVERAYCDIFQTPVTRPMAFRLLNFYFTLTAAPVAVAVAMLGASEVIRDGGGWVLRFFSLAVPYVMIFSALKLFPTTRVRWRPALVGATVSWLLFVAAGRLFPLYISLFVTRNPLQVVYGSVGLLPVFLVWLYLLWVIVLLGVEIAYVAQNYHSLVQAELDEEELTEVPFRVPELADGIEMAIRLAWHFEHSDGPITQEQLANETAMSPREARLVLEVLAKAELVARTEEGWLMARAPTGVTLQEVGDRWRSCTGVRRTHDDPLGDQIAEALRGCLTGTLHEAASRYLGPPA